MATTVKCDNPRCDAVYEVSSVLGGHTFTCNKCGSRVTIRDLSEPEARVAHPKARPPLPLDLLRFARYHWRLLAQLLLPIVAGLLIAYFWIRAG
jgi:hypothetical protein